MKYKIVAESDVSFRQLIESFKYKGYTYRYLPAQLLSDTIVQVPEGRINEEEYVPDELNPYLPNILLIVTPEMKREYRKFGKLVGFDLTFSLVRERTKKNQEYMVGVMAGTNGSKKIIIFGLVFMNTQSIFAYKYVFR